MRRALAWLYNIIDLIWQAVHMLTVDEKELEQIGEKYQI